MAEDPALIPTKESIPLSKLASSLWELSPNSGENLLDFPGL